MNQRTLYGMVTIAAVAACLSLMPRAEAMQTTPASGITLPTGYKAVVVASGLHFPTHLSYGPDGALYVTQLYSGDENAAVGQVVRLAPPDMTPQVMLSNLLKPTGLAWAGDDLYIVARNNLLISHFSAGTFSPPQTLLADLPFNGRSNGQIALGPDGYLYFQSTGTEGAPNDSGFIYRLLPGSHDVQKFAHGFKNAYAFAWVAADQSDTAGTSVAAGTAYTMYSTEIGDGAIPDVGQPPEKLVVVRAGADYGWPQCYGDRLPNPLWAGTAEHCATVERPLAMFPHDSTPTGLAWFDGQLIVALWNGNPARLVSVDPASGQVSDWASGFQVPIALLIEPAGSLLVVDMLGQQIVRISKNG